MKPEILLKAVALGCAAIGLAVAPASAEDAIKIGVVTPLSGTYAPIGQQVRWGLELATKEANAGGGVLGRKIELLFEDEEANPAVATQKAEKLFQVEKVDFLTGTVNSGSTLVVGQVAERNNRLMATTVSFADSITADKCSPNVFRVNAAAGMQANALAAWLATAKQHPKTFYFGPDYEMGRSTVAAFKQRAEAIGAKTVGEIYAPLGAKDYSQYFGQIRAAQPEVLYTSVAGNDTVRFLTQMDEYGLLGKVQILGASGTLTTQNIGAIGKAAEGYVTGVGYSQLIDTPENKAFVQSFKTATGSEPDLYGADSYGFIAFFKAGAEKAKSVDTDKLREAMSGIEWTTPQGKKTMRAGDHQGMMSMYAVQVNGGAFKIQSTIPAERAIGPDNCSRF
jgi:branched-chain amino acid transport system substrate-binding protein